MRHHQTLLITRLSAAIAIGLSHAPAAEPQQAAAAPVSEAASKLEAEYAATLDALRKDIIKDLPEINGRQLDDYRKLREIEIAAEAKVDAAKKALGKVGEAGALVEHAKGKWIGGAEKGIAAAETALKKATTDAEREAAKKSLTKWQADRTAGLDALKTRQEALDKGKLEEPKLNKALETARDEWTVAQVNTLKAVSQFNLESFLTNDKLDGRLVKFVVLAQATPRGLATFARQGAAQQALVDKLLADNQLMKQMLVADGAKQGQYGRAMEIYTAIQQASPKATEGVLQRLALAVSLEHAMPVKQDNPEDRTDAPAAVDPVKRYLHFEKAFLDNELDPAFKDLTVWDYRNTVNGDETDEVLTWGRQMLRNYRPDHISNPDNAWRYVETVETEVKYGSLENKNDLPSLHNYQNIIMNGGVCGRRAFFGRFILRCFGIPTLARPQVGHATLVHWTPDGWVICFGADWGAGRINNHSDIDFLAMTQARMTGDAYLQVLRAHWIGDVLGEKRAFGFHSGTPGTWNDVALYHQRAIIEKAKAVALAAVGTDIGEANESKIKKAIRTEVITDADKTISANRDGVITIPAVACSKPTNSTGRIRFMKSHLGGMQLHYSRMGQPEEFEYTFDAPAAGKYALSAQVVTTSANQHLLVAANDAKESTDIAVPFTVGMWDKTPPVEIPLVTGRNVLRFSRDGENIKGLTIKDFTLTPVR